MAGYVHITNNIGLSMSSVSFNAIIALYRRLVDSMFYRRDKVDYATFIEEERKMIKDLMPF